MTKGQPLGSPHVHRLSRHRAGGKGCEAFAALARAIPVCLLAPADPDLGLPFALSPRHLQSQGLGNTKSLLTNDTIRN
jgi:hypothetical protein